MTLPSQHPFLLNLTTILNYKLYPQFFISYGTITIVILKTSDIELGMIAFITIVLIFLFLVIIIVFHSLNVGPVKVFHT